MVGLDDLSGHFPTYDSIRAVGAREMSSVCSVQLGQIVDYFRGDSKEEHIFFFFLFFSLFFLFFLVFFFPSVVSVASQT